MNQKRGERISSNAGLGIETKGKEEKRMPVFISSCCHILLLLVLLGMCQVSEECPAVCECKWKSGKESVICANSKTKLTEIPSGLDPGTQVLDLSGNSLKTLPANVFLTLNLLNLQKIYLSDCSLKSLDRLAFAKLKNLVELDLSGNRQEFVPSHAFGQIQELRELKMNSNPISRISNDAFVDLSRLVRLELSGCRIGTIEMWAFRGLPVLEWLRLDNNRLFTVQAISFFPLQSLHGLEIHGNPWNCTCALQPFRKWMGKNNVPFGVPPVCSTPQRLTGKLWNELALEDFACLPKSYWSRGDGTGINNKLQHRIQEGENATITCQWEATPDTKVRWWYGSKLIATNGGSGLSSSFQVTESFRWELNGSTLLPATGEGRKSNSRPLSSSGQNSMHSTTFPSTGKFLRNFTSDRGIGLKISTLIVIRATSRDAGTYTCRAESRAGSAMTNFTIIVLQNKAEHLTGRFLLFGAVLAALLTLVVSLLLVCVVFGSSRRHYQSSRIATDDKLELNHVGGTRMFGQNGGGSVPLMENHHNSHHRHNLSKYGDTNVTTNSLLSRRTMSNGESNCGSTGCGSNSHDKGREYKVLSTMEPDDSSSELENNGSDQDDGEADQDDSVSPIAPATNSTTTTALFVATAGGSGRNNGSSCTSGPQQQKFTMVMSRKPGSLQHFREGKIGIVSPENSEKSSAVCSQIRSEITGPRESVGGNSATSSISTPGAGASQQNKVFSDLYPDLIDEKMSLGSDFQSLPRPNKNHNYKDQLPYKPYYAHQKQHLVDSGRGYFHRRNNSDSQSPLLCRSYGNSTEKITSSGISVLSSSSTESSYVSTYQPPYTISQSHIHQPPQYRGSFKGSPTTNFQHSQNLNTFSNYPTRQRLSMPTSPVHDHYSVEHGGAPSVGVLRHHTGSHDEGRRSSGGLLSPSERGISYVKTASSGPVGSSSNVSYDYHAAQLAAFLEEYRQLQSELMRMSASLQQHGSGRGHAESQQHGSSSPLSDASTVSGGNSNVMGQQPSPQQQPDLKSNVNNASSKLFKSSSNSTRGNSSLQHHHQQQLKSILKNSGNNNNYLA